MQVKVISDEIVSEHKVKLFISSTDIEMLLCEKAKTIYPSHDLKNYCEDVYMGDVFRGVYITLENNSVSSREPSIKEIP